MVRTIACTTKDKLDNWLLDQIDDHTIYVTSERPVCDIADCIQGMGKSNPVSILEMFSVNKVSVYDIIHQALYTDGAKKIIFDTIPTDVLLEVLDYLRTSCFYIIIGKLVSTVEEAEHLASLFDQDLELVTET